MFLYKNDLERLLMLYFTYVMQKLFWKPCRFTGCRL